MSPTKEVETTGPARDVASYLNAPYVRMLIRDPDEEGYLAEVLELPGCITDGDTPEEALRNLEEVMAGWIGASLDHDKPIPEPVGMKEYSGHFPLRISTELHRAAALRAIHEGVSLNQWIAKAITAQVARDNLAEGLADEIAEKVAGQISVKVTAGMQLKIEGLPSEAATSRDFTRTAVTPDVLDSRYDSYWPLAALLGGSFPATQELTIIKAGKEVKEDA